VRRHQIAWLAALAAAAVVLFLPTTAGANAVTSWNEFAARTLLAFPGPAGGAPPASQVHMGMVQGAVYDAVNAIEPRRRPYLLARRFDARASKEAAVATAPTACSLTSSRPFPPGSPSLTGGAC
jgi:hypothetical protein